MAYCSTTAIYTSLPKLPATNTASGYSTCADVISLHIRRADGLINGKCARRYSVPFTTVPPYIRTLAEDIVSYYVMRSFYSQDAQNRSEYLEEFKDKALEDLDAIMNGDIDLVDTSGSAIPVQTTEVEDRISSTTEDYQPFFDIDDSTDWAFDEDRLDEVEDARD